MWSKTRRAQLTIMHDSESGVEVGWEAWKRHRIEKDTYMPGNEMKNIKILTVITYRLHILNAINFVHCIFYF